MSLSFINLLFGNNFVQYHDENFDTEIEEMNQELADLEEEGRQLDTFISDSGIFK